MHWILAKPLSGRSVWLLAGCLILWFPQWVQAQTSYIPIRIRQIILNGVEVMPQPGQPLVLERRKNTLIVRFENPFPDKSAEFMYQIQPDSGWTPLGYRRDIVITNLPAHDCIFEIKSIDTPIIAAIYFALVAQPFWQKTWFWPVSSLLLAGILGIAMYLFFLYRYRQKVHLLHVRENIARDLHDDMGSYLSSISMLSQSVLNVARKDPQQARLLVDKIGETARQVMDSMSDIIWSINPDNDSMAQVVVRMRDVATDLLGAQDITLYQDIDDAVSQVHLPLEQRRDFFLIYKEALTNVSKYASASHVWVRLHRRGAAIVLTIQDDGIGFDTQQAVGRNPLGGNGLKNMRARAEKLGGSLVIESVEGQGTRLEVQILVQ